MKEIIKKIPVINTIANYLYTKFILKQPEFSSSADYWNDRYNSGGNSGAGSYGQSSEFKARVLNGFLSEHKVETVIEYGCGDGNQLGMINYPAYLGFDVSAEAVKQCSAKYAGDKSKNFKAVNDYDGETAELTLSLDVIYHLVEDEIFTAYMDRLFDSSNAYVILYSTDTTQQYKLQAEHVKHRKFTDWIKDNKPEWKQLSHIKNDVPINDEYNDLFVDFFIYQKK